MIIIGIDPGVATIGYGIVRVRKVGCKTKDNFECLGYGSIKTNPTMAMPQRLKKINNELAKIMTEYQPKIMAVENIYFFKNMKTAMPVSQAKGVIMLTAAKKNVPVYEFSPAQVKMLVAGSGKAEKTQVQKKIQSIFGLKDLRKSDDAADALAIALTYVFARKA